MKRIFLDANIIIDYLNVDAKDHANAKVCLQIVRTHYGKPIVSPFTLLITNFVAGKFIRDRKWHRSQMQMVFSGFEISAIKSSAITTVFESAFLDLEDGLQYQCALSAKANAIITKDVHEYFPSTIPVIHPLDFVSRYRSMFNS